ncbi:MAG TPA: hypothetical protein VGE26_01940 [Sphingobacteriaceae bacterium]
MNITKRIVERVMPILKRLDYVLVNRQTYSTDRKYYYDVLAEFSKGRHEEKIESIVFSKNRAMQLHAFLSSYKNMVDDPGRIYVIYKASPGRHEQSYNQLKEIFTTDPVIFIEENNFRLQLIEVCERSRAKTVGLFVDDMIFTQKVSYSTLVSINTLEYTPTLSRGSDLDFSQVLNKPLIVPNLTPYKNGLHSFSWNSSKVFSDWTYPLGVSGYFYGREELIVMLHQLVFNTPNSLESSMQRFLPLYINRKGLCYSKVACVCVHANMVQTEANNPVLGTFSVEELLAKWEAGLKIDISPFVGKSAEAQFLRYEFYKEAVSELKTQDDR